MRQLWIGVLLGLLCPTPAAAWGYVAHRIIAENACDAMPPAIHAFFKSVRQRISDASIEPDTLLKPRGGDAEKIRHFINLENLSSAPFTDIPASEKEARARYGSSRLEDAGILPWHVATVYADLREAFRARAWDEAARLSGWLSHYASDAFQPLHTTVNYDGQRSCNQGIHMAFEADMIDRYKARYRAETAPAPAAGARAVAPDPAALMLDVIRDSYGLVDKLLRADTRAVRQVKSRRADYLEELESQAGPIARQQMKKAASMLTRLWQAAWEEAGSPELPERAPPRAPR